jgi:hypothetical protein
VLLFSVTIGRLGGFAILRSKYSCGSKKTRGSKNTPLESRINSELMKPPRRLRRQRELLMNFLFFWPSPQNHEFYD